MGYATRVQVIRREASEQYYVNLPVALARAMGFSKGEEVAWEVKGEDVLVLRRVRRRGQSSRDKRGE